MADADIPFPLILRKPETKTLVGDGQEFEIFMYDAYFKYVICSNRSTMNVCVARNGLNNDHSKCQLIKIH